MYNEPISNHYFNYNWVFFIKLVNVICKYYFDGTHNLFIFLLFMVKLTEISCVVINAHYYRPIYSVLQCYCNYYVIFECIINILQFILIFSIKIIILNP